MQWLCWQPTPYNAVLFRALDAEPSLELHVRCIARVVASHPWQSSLTEGLDVGYFAPVLGIDWSVARQAARDRRSLFVIAGWHDATMQCAMATLALRRQPFAIWTDTPDLTTRRSRLKGMLRNGFLRWIFRRATWVMGTGQRALDALSAMGCAEAKLVDFPFFVDLAQWPSSAEREEAQTPPVEVIRFASSGRLRNEMKGHHIALAALASARERTGCTSFEYTIAGSGPDLESLEQQVRRLDLERHVKFAGWLEPEQLVHLLASSHALIHPSLSDPFPVAVLEAMAAGLVVLGSDGCGSVVDRIRHGENGFIHRAGDVQDLAAHISHLIQSPSSLRMLGIRARQTAEAWPVSRGVALIKSLAADLPARR